jgi:hypothetical protein
MTAIREHFAHHRLHMLGCAAACATLISAIVIGIPALAIVAAFACATMMIGMVWMMVVMSRHH